MCASSLVARCACSHRWTAESLRTSRLPVARFTSLPVLVPPSAAHTRVRCSWLSPATVKGGRTLVAVSWPEPLVSHWSAAARQLTRSGPERIYAPSRAS
jgi:hypothetical protein